MEEPAKHEHLFTLTLQFRSMEELTAWANAHIPGSVGDGE